MEVGFMRAQLGQFGVVAIVALAVAAPAWSHTSGATYSGAFAGGGAVSFDVSADGNTVTRIMFQLTTSCGSANINTNVDATANTPIGNGAFSQSFGSVTFKGTFGTSQMAQGTVE